MGTLLKKRWQSNNRPEPAWEIAKLFPPHGSWSEADYLALQTNHLVEFSHGTVEVLPTPTERHQSIVAYLFTLFAALATEINGKVLFAPFRLQLLPGKFREPDLVFLRAADDPRRADRYWTGAAIVVEVVSPDDPKRDIITKRDEYARAGIPGYWIVDPQGETITVLLLAGDGYAEHGRYTRGFTATSPFLANTCTSGKKWGYAPFLSYLTTYQGRVAFTREGETG